MSFLTRMAINTLKGKAVQKAHKSFVENGGVQGLKSKAAEKIAGAKSTLSDVASAVKEGDLEKGAKAATEIGQGIGGTVKSAAGFAADTVTEIITDTATSAKQLQDGTKEFFNDVSEKSEQIKAEKANDNAAPKAVEKAKTPKAPGSNK